MSKKIVVMGMLLLLFSGMVSAIDINIPQNILPPVMDDESTQTAGDLWVWLEVPENLPAPGQKFWVNLYITPFRDTSVYKLQLKLKPTNNNVKFTGLAALIAQNTWQQIYADPSDGSLLLNHPATNEIPARYYQKYKLGRVEMIVNNQGSFGISLVKAESGALDVFMPYTLKQGNTRVLRNSHCVPNPAACSGKCGTANDGCGNIVTCSSCAPDKICVSNACVTVLSQLPIDSQKACLMAVSAPAAGDKILLQTIGETLQDWGKSCTTNANCRAGYSCVSNTCTATELSILSPMFTAIKTWLVSKFP